MYYDEPSDDAKMGISAKLFYTKLFWDNFSKAVGSDMMKNFPATYIDAKLESFIRSEAISMGTLARGMLIKGEL
jgi:hypothetical protein